jgi:hypothetical protein
VVEGRSFITVVQEEELDVVKLNILKAPVIG